MRSVTETGAADRRIGTALTDLRNQRDDGLAQMWDTIKRVRAIMMGAYGDDSSQYELIGGTHRNDRKRAARRTQA